ncbi:hypothetical protein [uncultured Gammaproteobacteria bacterium]|nr:hypothetical protein [uncultured Gammaproteobacteria bacterium]
MGAINIVILVITNISFVEDIAIDVVLVTNSITSQPLKTTQNIDL